MTWVLACAHCGRPPELVWLEVHKLVCQSLRRHGVVNIHHPMTPTNSSGELSSTVARLTS